MEPIIFTPEPDITQLEKRLEAIARPSPTSLCGDPKDHQNFSPHLYHKETKIITENQQVLIRLPSGGAKIVKLVPGGVISLGKFGSFHVDQVLGHQFGSGFEITEVGQVERCDISKFYSEIDDFLDQQDESAEYEDAAAGYSKDNSNLIDLGSSTQKLTAQDIETMKNQSYTSESGQKIIEQIIAQHGNFDKKTKYSQVKYLKRKKQKYSRSFIIEYLSSTELLKFYIQHKDLRKSLDISEETVALMMNLGNIRPGGKYLVIDEMLGLLVYAMLERMNGKGQIIILSENPEPNVIALTTYSNYPSIYINRMVKKINFLQALSPISQSLQFEESVMSFDRAQEQYKLDTSNDSSKTLQFPGLSKSSSIRKLQNYRNFIEVLYSFKSGNFDGLITVSTLDIPSMVGSLLPYVGGSRNVVIYSQFKELLVDLYHYVNDEAKENGLANGGKLPLLGTAIHEIRVRPYQAVPGKIHPMMTMRGGGGYVFFGIRIFPLEQVEAIGQGNKKRKVEKKSDERE